MASGDDVAVLDFSATFLACGDLCRFHSLYAVGAFFHHTTTANGNFGVHHQRLELSIGTLNVAGEGIPAVSGSNVFVVVEVVETPNFERAVVCTVTSSNASVVSHCIDAFVSVDGCRYGANLLTGSRFAVHTSDWLLHDISVFFIALEVTINA